MPYFNGNPIGLSQVMVVTFRKQGACWHLQGTCPRRVLLPAPGSWEPLTLTVLSPVEVRVFLSASVMETARAARAMGPERAAGTSSLTLSHFSRNPCQLGRTWSHPHPPPPHEPQSPLTVGKHFLPPHPLWQRRARVSPVAVPGGRSCSRKAGARVPFAQSVLCPPRPPPSLRPLSGRG